VYQVAITAPLTAPGEVAGRFEFSNDLGRSTFGNADLDGDVSEPEGRVGGDALEDVGVIRYESKRMVSIS
jgi:hypothetical protein